MHVFRLIVGNTCHEGVFICDPPPEQFVTCALSYKFDNKREYIVKVVFYFPFVTVINNWYCWHALCHQRWLLNTSSYKENGSRLAVVKGTLHLQLGTCYHDFRLCGWVVREELFGGVQWALCRVPGL